MPRKKVAQTTPARPAAPRQPERIPLRITDTTLRDAHQSLWATRMRTTDIIDIIDTVDAAGFYSLEVWGGATFDVCLRFLRENPWERLRQIKAKATKTPLQMLLRGQNILGYRNYPDDLLDRFVDLACENGIDIFRIFDALNDCRNLEHAIQSVKRNGAHAQGTICYTVSPVHTVEKYCEIAREQAAMGVDSLCIKDMAGILSPIAAERLVSALVKEVNVPIQMHCHATSGMATATYVEGVRAGAGAIDCAISVMSGFSSQPPVETMLSIFEETSYRASLDRDALREMCRYFTNLAPSRRLSHHPANVIDPDILVHHIPGGMISNLRSQLEQQGALDRLDDVLAEIPRTRADLGYPPLVTPTSQIVGVQAAMNVLAGERYAMVPQETKDYVAGLYGRAPAPIKASIRRKILGRQKPVSRRPADLLKPMLPRATDGVEAGLIRKEEDIISYCLFPEPALGYFKWRNLPPDRRPPSPADVEREQQDRAKQPPAPPVKPIFSETDSRILDDLMHRVRDLGLSELTIRRGEVSIGLRAAGLHAQAADAPQAEAPAANGPQPGAADKPAANGAAATDPPPSGPTIDAPLNGTFFAAPGPNAIPFVKEGDKVAAGATVCIVEAMKLFNQIKAPFACRIRGVLAQHGQSVTKGDPMLAIEPL